MCRWVAYSGDAIPIEELLLNLEHSLIDQSLSAKMAPQPTNGDGFGIGWYGREMRPLMYHSIQPAWNDANLRDLAYQIESPLFLAHVRRSTGTPVQTSNCHPFRHENWLFVHNGLLRGFPQYKRALMLEVDPRYFPDIRGSTDSEIMFYLLLTFGLATEPLAAVERMIALIERLARDAGAENAIQMTLGITNGNDLYAVRYSTERQSRTLYHSESMEALYELHPEDAAEEIFPMNARAVVSEPLTDVRDWVEIPESSALQINDGVVEMVPIEIPPG